MKYLRVFRSIQAKLILMVLMLILIAVQLIGVYFISAMKSSLIESFTTTLNNQVNLLTSLSASALAEQDKSGGARQDAGEELKALAGSLSTFSGAEIQVLDAGGRVLTTSKSTDPSIIGRKNTSLLVSRALQRIPDNEEEIIDDQNERKKIIAKPVINEGKVVGAVYITASMKDLYQTVERINRIFVSAILIALGLTAVLGVLLAGTITAPIKALTRQVTAVAEGRFDQRVPVFGTDEIGQLSAAFNDMTDRLSEALALGEEEKEKLSSVLSNMSDGVLATDELGRVIIANRRAQAMLGSGGWEGRTLSEALNVDKGPIAETLEGKESWLLLRREAEDGGDEMIVRVTLTPIRRRDKGVAGAIAVLHDITEAEKLEQSRREFVANVSHELRTPLTTIKSYAEALDDGAMEERDLARRFVGVIRNETERMIRLVSDLLHLSRFDSRRLQLRREKINMNEMLDEVVDRFSFQLRQKAITATVQASPDLQPVWLDRDGIDQVLDNLVSNAVKYTLDGGTIKLSAFCNPAGQLCVVVKDTGIGIPKKDLERIFDRFYRVDKARSRNMGGTGLGLSIAREIVRAHGGAISIESESGAGTAVTVTLPIVQEGSEPA
ncbi:cell wall metabolism sensor histidine kinase WalK [Cohnella sp. CFH 77786]|uniref:cell wall metabolism sensor histidine kinase WalK n=1 Tax=Cohnella sp. CFH 77786 TaxID=2662265 RepID=UPI001C60DEB7|nr:cell wall metabolism sensor histidine kinase WalK [Cohnella sp. CFH 77786]MBW5448756.1 cell wall metabolism sensor histidine kinase WalK [Cohnella sp. CFH 77786]